MISQHKHISPHAKRLLNQALKSGKRHVYHEFKQGLVSYIQLVTAQSNLHILLRTEADELVFVAVAGNGLYYAINELLKFAVATGAKTVRFHTRSPKKLRAVDSLPFTLIARNGSEHVFRMTLR